MKYINHFSESISNFDDYYNGDKDHLPAIFVLSSFEVDDYYFDKQEYSKSKMKEVAEFYRLKIEENSKMPIYCFGTNGKYLLTPSKNILLIDDFYEYKDFRFTRPEPFHFEYFKIPGNHIDFYSPQAFITKICNGIGAEELIPKLIKQIAPVEEYFNMNISKWNPKNFKVK